MQTMKIAEINGISLISETLNGETLIPIRPLCQALGISPNGQRDRIQSDPFLSPTGVLSTSVGADGKSRDMYCLPLRYVFGWLCSISSACVSEEARPSLMKYQHECYDVLWEHFYGKIQAQSRLNEKENEIYAAKVEAMNRASESKKSLATANADIRRCDEQLETLRRQRLDDQPTLPGMEG